MGYEDLIPDFNDMQELTDEIGRAKAQLINVKANIQALQATLIKEALTNTNHWIGGKQPSMSYCKEVVSVIGNTDIDAEELRELVLVHAETVEKLAMLEGLYQIYKDKFDLYRTISANERKAHF